MGKKCANLKNRISLQTRSKMAAVSCFRVGFSDQKSIASWDRIGLTTRPMNGFPLEFLATDFQHRWQKYFTPGDWLKPETAHERSVAPKVWPKVQPRIKTQLSWVNWDARYDIEWLNWRSNSFAIFALVQLLWNVTAINRQKPITRHSAEHLRYSSYPKNSLSWEFRISI